MEISKVENFELKISELSIIVIKYLNLICD